jgi:hypothetical protein
MLRAKLSDIQMTMYKNIFIFITERLKVNYGL